MASLPLRIADTLIALFWAWVLIRSLMSGFIGGQSHLRPTRQHRPGQYWFLIFIFALMVVHFGGLAIVGQRPLG